MARPRRSRSLREEQAEAEKLANDDENEIHEQEQPVVQNVQTGQIRPKFKSVKPQRAPGDNSGSNVHTPRKLPAAQGEEDEDHHAERDHRGSQDGGVQTGNVKRRKM